MTLKNINCPWNFTAEIRDLLEEGSLLQTLMTIPQEKKISRIKEVRSSTGMNLIDAKKALDEVNDLIPYIYASDNSDENPVKMNEVLRSELKILCETLREVRDENEDLRLQIGNLEHKENFAIGLQKNLQETLARMNDKAFKARTILTFLEEARDEEERENLSTVLRHYLNAI